MNMKMAMAAMGDDDDDVDNDDDVETEDDDDDNDDDDDDNDDDDDDVAGDDCAVSFSQQELARTVFVVCFNRSADILVAHAPSPWADAAASPDACCFPHPIRVVVLVKCL